MFFLFYHSFILVWSELCGRLYWRWFLWLVSSVLFSELCSLIACLNAHSTQRRMQKHVVRDWMEQLLSHSNALCQIFQFCLLTRCNLQLAEPSQKLFMPEGGYKFCTHMSVCPSVHPKLYVSAIPPVSLDGFLTNFTFVIGATWHKDELVTFCIEKVKGQGHIIVQH